MVRRASDRRTGSRVCSAFLLLALGAGAGVALTGCGQTGAPLAPSLQLPSPVTDLTALRVGDRVTLSWTMPRRTTDRLPLQGLQSVRVCRGAAGAPCQEIGDGKFAPEKAAAFEDTLGADLSGGAPQLLSYSVEVMNHRDHSAGASNLAYSSSGQAPPALASVTGTATANGVLLSWQPVPLQNPDNKVAIERTLISAPPVDRAKTKAASFANFQEAAEKEQTLVVRLPAGRDPGKALDPDAQMDSRYEYRVARVETLSVGGKSIEVNGAPTAAVLVDTKDVFPPGAPAGLAAVAAPEDGAIDLSWAPNMEPDLAGYAVYRRVEGGQPERLTEPTPPLATPAFRDLTARPGQPYTYSVTAIDRDGNESARSAEAAETLPARQ